MNIHASDVILMAHATFGVLGTLAALWVFVEALNANEGNAQRTQTAAYLVAAFMASACVVGGYWYVRFYPADRAMILKGPWPFAHTIFMETKEHLFFITLILALYLPIAAGDQLHSNASARKMVLAVALMIVLTGLAMEGSGAIINHGAKLAFLHAAMRGTP
jgi:heme/copper-type cytochrome/quinol oxidase subunit 4